MRLDEVVEFENMAIHEAVIYAARCLPAGSVSKRSMAAAVQRVPNPDNYPVVQASIPDEWSRTFPAENYKSYYTLNDGTVSG